MTKERKATRLSKAAREFNVGISTIVDFLSRKGYTIDPNPNSKLPAEVYDLLVKEYSSDLNVKKESEKLLQEKFAKKKETLSIEDVEKGDDPDSDEGEDEVIVKDPAEPSRPVVEPEEKKQVEAGDETQQPVKKEDDEEAVPEESAKEPAEEAAPDKESDVKRDKGINIIGKIDIDAIERSGAKKKKKDAAAKEVEESVEKEPPPPAETKEEETPLPATDKEAGEKEEDREGDAEKAAAEEVTEEQSQPKDEESAEDGDTSVPAAEEKVSPEKEEKEQEKRADDADDEEPADEKIFKTEVRRLSGPTVVGKIDLPAAEKKRGDSEDDKVRSDEEKKRKKRKRIRKDKERVALKPDGKGKEGAATSQGRKKKRPVRPEVSEEDVQKQVKETLARLTSKGKTKGSRYRREKRDTIVQRQQQEVERQELEKSTIKVTEFVSVNELASMMDVPVTEVISTCLNLGLMVSINQRLDAETMALVAEEFGYKAEFVSADLEDSIKETEDAEEDLKPRPPIVTVMGHVDHGKTRLLDHIRKENVIAGEAGGITQHIGAYHVTLEDGRSLTFLDTPGHEAFTAMRARGAQITDVAIIVVAADDGVMPQTKEAINHASAAGVPIVFAINKIDKPTANIEKIKEELAQLNYLVEDWGGKYQSQEISAKNGINIDLLLDKVLLESELLELRANPDKQAVGTVIESSLDRGKGYVATILVKAGSLKVGDIVLAGNHFGHVKAMHNERGKKINSAGPSMPVLILGLNGAPQAGDKFNVMGSDKEAKEIANRRQQLQREQDMRTQKHITLDEIGRRIAIGSFQELNIIVKGDVDGSVEALSDSLIKLSTEEIQVNVIHKAVGQISESDILLAAASNAIIVGFQVRPSISARKLAEKEQIDIRLYSIIYSAIEEIKSAMEGMLSPEEREEITGAAEIRDLFKITKVGTVAGCLVREGKIARNSKIRVIRDGIVIYTGDLGSLKRFKDDVKEVSSGYECGLNVENFNDIKVGDIIESFRITEVKKTL